MAAATAIISAAMATEVRDSAATILRVASRPSRPKAAPATRCSGRSRPSAAAGDERAAHHQHEEPGEADDDRSEEHTSELQSRLHLVCRLLLETKNLSS